MPKFVKNVNGSVHVRKKDVGVSENVTVVKRKIEDNENLSGSGEQRKKPSDEKGKNCAEKGRKLSVKRRN